MPPEDLIVS